MEELYLERDVYFIGNFLSAEVNSDITTDTLNLIERYE